MTIPVCLVLGDNVFYGDGLKECLDKAQQNTVGATIFGVYVHDSESLRRC